MNESIASPLEAWGNFYVIVGSSAGALTGLQFVVMTLIAQTDRGRSRGEAISAFGTPNVVHFCAVLLVAAIISVPWSTLRGAGLAVAGCGVLGTLYSVIVMRRARRQREYEPVLEDWLWHTILPALGYLAMLVAGAVLERSSAGALLVIGAAALLLVFIGIHNAWDTVTYVTMRDGIGTDGGASVRTVPETPRGSNPASTPVPGVASAGESPTPQAPDTPA